MTSDTRPLNYSNFPPLHLPALISHPSVLDTTALIWTAVLYLGHLGSGTRILLLASLVRTSSLGSSRSRADRALAQIPEDHAPAPCPQRGLLPAPKQTHEDKIRPLRPREPRHYHHFPGFPATGRSRVRMTYRSARPPRLRSRLISYWLTPSRERGQCC